MEIRTINDAFKEYKSKKTNVNELVIFLLEDNCLKYQYNFTNEYDLEIVYDIALTLLYTIGANTVCIYGENYIYQSVKERLYNSTHYDFFKKIYNAFEVKYISNLLDENIINNSYKINIKNSGKTIGIDVGGSDIKVVCLEDEKLRYSNEIIWHPKDNENINYHINMINSVIDEAITYLNNDVDNIKISSAGVIKNDEILLANLFEKVDFYKHKNDINNFYINAIKRVENRLNKKINFIVLNDGDVSSIAGMNHYKLNNVLGLALGTSLASGYVNDNKIFCYLNEMSSNPFDLTNNLSCADYLSQEGVIRFAKEYNIEIDENLSKAEKLKIVQNLFNENNENAKKVFYKLGYLLADYIDYISNFLNIENIILQGRVLSNNSGLYLYNSCVERLKIINKKVNIILPDEKFVRIGQAYSVALIDLDDC